MRNLPLWLCCLVAPLVACQEKSDAPGGLPANPAVATANEPASAAVPQEAPSDAPKGAPTKTAASAPPAEGAKSPLKKGNLRTDPPPLEDVNRWATDAGVRDNLLSWLQAGLSIPADVSTNIDIKYSGGEVPHTALVTVTLDGYLDDSIRGERFELKFSRKACSDCSTGMSGWWLYALSATVRCYEGRGHTDYSADLCN